MTRGWFRGFPHSGRGTWKTLSAGFTLLEMLIVIVILAIGTAVVMPGMSASNQAQVDLVTEKVVTALRFTRSEAIRTGIAHGIILDHDGSNTQGKDIVVYQLDTSSSPVSIGHVVNQPVTRQPYDIALVERPGRRSIGIQNSTAAFLFDQVGSSQHLHFSPDGRPVNYSGGDAHRLISGIIQVGDSSGSRTVTLSPVNGQVSVQ